MGMRADGIQPPRTYATDQLRRNEAAGYDERRSRGFKDQALTAVGILASGGVLLFFLKWIGVVG